MSEQGEIFTFYSYKGGTGRSMALANVACLLAAQSSNGNKVLAIDWDLEAPGLHRFFRSQFRGALGNDEQRLELHPGLIDLFRKLASQFPSGNESIGESETRKLVDSLNLDDYVLKSDIPHLSLMKAGCFDENYP